ncbi:unnamed protein product [Protopolystoma xenopodis]|uniref:Tubulin/FtsZ 2-layer sandwich domain-containing protein n=1 Tax=Protopolystoma xenopodis TaxID=117903 RepID=A0A448XIG6_9PLAT|nr:unnamed protein product [Protopolystoma xenopodis]
MVHELTNSVFAPDNQLMLGNPDKMQFLACALLCRGDISVRDIRNAVIRLKSKRQINMVDWCPTGFKASYDIHKILPGFRDKDIIWLIEMINL